MGKAIFVQLPGIGHVNPTLPVISGLVRRGEEIIIVNTNDFAYKYNNLGAEFKPYSAEGAEHFHNHMKTVDDYVFALSFFCSGTIIVLPELITLVNDVCPDYILSDSACIWGRILAEYLKLPLIESCTFFSVARGDEKGKVSLLDNIANHRYHEISRKEWFIDFQKIMKNKYGCNELAPYDFLVNYGDLNIVFTSKYFHPNGNSFDDSFKFVGPIITNRSEAYDFIIDLNNKKLIYVSLGTVFNNNETAFHFYTNCIKVFTGSDFEVIISTGGGIDASIFKNIPPNINIHNYVPQLEVLKRANLFITHGGMNSVNEALYYGVPLFLIPMGVDQPMVARQVQKLGAGRMIDADSIDFKTLKKVCIEIIENPSYKESSVRISNSYRNCGGYNRAVDEILRFTASVCE